MVDWGLAAGAGCAELQAEFFLDLECKRCILDQPMIQACTAGLGCAGLQAEFSLDSESKGVSKRCILASLLQHYNRSTMYQRSTEAMKQGK